MTPPLTSHKHITVRGDKQTIKEHYEPVTKYTRAGKNGKNIKCPRCGAVHRVYHFAWSGATCPKCTMFVTKYEWLVDQLDTWRTPR